jgi:hypothetical protein
LREWVDGDRRARNSLHADLLSAAKRPAASNDPISLLDAANKTPRRVSAVL